MKSLSLGVCVFVVASLWMVEAKTDECWLNDAVRCRSAYRGGNSPDFRFVHLGFRLALSPIQ